MVQLLVPKHWNANFVHYLLVLLPAIVVGLTAVIWVSYYSLGEHSLLQGSKIGLWGVISHNENERKIVDHYPFFVFFLIPLVYRIFLDIITTQWVNHPQIIPYFERKHISQPQDIEDLPLKTGVV